MAVRTFSLTDEASLMLDAHVKEMKKHKKKVTQGGIVSEAIKFYCLSEQKGKADEMIERVIEHRFIKFENRLAAMLANVGIDVDMILHEILEQRQALEENRDKDPRDVYNDLRQEGVALFSKKKAFQAGM